MESLLNELTEAVYALYRVSPSSVKNSDEMYKAVRAADKATLLSRRDFEALWRMEREDAMAAAIQARRASRGAPGTYRVVRTLPAASPIQILRSQEAFQASPIGASAPSSPVAPTNRSWDSPV